MEADRYDISKNEKENLSGITAYCKNSAIKLISCMEIKILSKGKTRKIKVKKRTAVSLNGDALKHKASVLRKTCRFIPPLFSLK